MAKRWQDWMAILVGLWLAIAPLLLAFADGYGSTAAWNSYLSALVILVAAVVALQRPAAWQEWLLLVMGIWLLVSSFILGLDDDQLVMWNNIVAGIVIVLSAVSALNWIRIRPND